MKRLVLLYLLVAMMIILTIIYFAVAEDNYFVGQVNDIQEQVYDGDTIKDVLVKVATDKTPDGEVWPGVHIIDGDVYVSFDLRINGIDTPEKRPKKAGRTAQSLINEKLAANKARDAVVKLVEKGKKYILIKNPETGKYAGRMLGDAFIKDGKQLISIADHLIKHGHALQYDGGTKAKVNWDVLDKGYMVPEPITTED